MSLRRFCVCRSFSVLLRLSLQMHHNIFEQPCNTIRFCTEFAVMNSPLIFCSRLWLVKIQTVPATQILQHPPSVFSFFRLIGFVLPKHLSAIDEAHARHAQVYSKKAALHLTHLNSVVSFVLTHSVIFPSPSSSPGLRSRSSYRPGTLVE